MLQLGPPVPLESLASDLGHSPEALFELARKGVIPGAYKLGKVWYYSPIREMLEIQRGQESSNVGQPRKAPPVRKGEVLCHDSSAGFAPPSWQDIQYKG